MIPATLEAVILYIGIVCVFFFPRCIILPTCWTPSAVLQSLCFVRSSSSHSYSGYLGVTVLRTHSTTSSSVPFQCHQWAPEQHRRKTKLLWEATGNLPYPLQKLTIYSLLLPKYQQIIYRCKPPHILSGGSDCLRASVEAIKAFRVFRQTVPTLYPCFLTPSEKTNTFLRQGCTSQKQCCLFPNT